VNQDGEATHVVAEIARFQLREAGGPLKVQELYFPSEGKLAPDVPPVMQVWSDAEPGTERDWMTKKSGTKKWTTGGRVA
jgi:hypothetical protein